MCGMRGYCPCRCTCKTDTIPAQSGWVTVKDTNTRITLRTPSPAQDYLGVEREYYRPVDRGFETELAQRLEAIRARLREARQAPNRTPS